MIDWLDDIDRGVLALTQWLRRLRPPGNILIHRKRQIDMSQFGITFSLPEASAADVTTQELTVTWGSEAATTTTYDATATTTDEYIGELPATIATSLVNIDAAGNRSTPAEQSFSEVDDVAPPEPGLVGIAAKRQIA